MKSSSPICTRILSAAFPSTAGWPLPTRPCDWRKRNRRTGSTRRMPGRSMIRRRDRSMPRPYRLRCTVRPVASACPSPARSWHRRSPRSPFPHTPYRVQSAGKTTLIWGDVLRVAVVQLKDPTVTIRFDYAPGQSIRQSHAHHERGGQAPILVTGAYLKFPGIGALKRGDDWQWVPLTSADGARSSRDRRMPALPLTDASAVPEMRLDQHHDIAQVHSNPAIRP